MKYVVSRRARIFVLVFARPVLDAGPNDQCNTNCLGDFSGDWNQHDSLIIPNRVI